MLCCDPNGQSIGFEGQIDPNQSGTYTSIMRLASQLDGVSLSTSSSLSSSSKLISPQGRGGGSPLRGLNDTTTTKMTNNDGGGAMMSTNEKGNKTVLAKNGGGGTNNGHGPCISIESDQSITLIKSYYGDHCVITKLPSTSLSQSGVSNGSSGAAELGEIRKEHNDLADGLLQNSSQSRPTTSSTGGGGVVSSMDEDGNVDDKVDPSEHVQS